MKDRTFYYYFVVPRFIGVVNLASVYVLILFLLLTAPFTLLNMAFQFINTYQAVKEWWKGPATIYSISIVVGM